MKIGLIARADKTGLAVQTWSFWRNLEPHKTLVVDLSYCSGKKPDMSQYPGARLWRTRTYPNKYVEQDKQLDDFLDGLDVVFTAETPYNYWLFERARERGVATVLQYNYEFLEYLLAPNLPRPTKMVAPSTWHIERVPFRVEHLPVPVDLDILRQSGAHRIRTELNTVIHSVGNPAMEDRSGTMALLEAMKYLKSDVQIKIRSQSVPREWRTSDKRVSFIRRSESNYWSQYSASDDVMVLPRRFGGLCLPMNEAMGLGIPVLMGDCPPNSSLLPKQFLVKGTRGRQIQTRAKINLYNVPPRRLAERIDELHRNPALVEEGSRLAADWAERHSWKTLKERYLQVLQDAIDQR